MMIQTQCYQSHSSGVIIEQTQEGDKSMIKDSKDNDKPSYAVTYTLLDFVCKGEYQRLTRYSLERSVGKR